MSLNENLKQGDIATLLFSCPQQVGTVAAVAHFFSQHGINVDRLEEITSDGHFFSRWQWQVNSDWDEESEFDEEFGSVATHFEAEFTVHFSSNQQTLGLLVKESTHTLIEVLNRQETAYFPHSELAFIISDSQLVSDIADRHGVPYFGLESVKETDRESKQLEIVHRYRPDVLGLCSDTQLLSGNFLHQAACPVITIKNAFIPSFSGPQAYHDAYTRGVKLVAATAQFGTEDVENGPIIEQDVASVARALSVQEMIRVGQSIEQKVFSRALRKVLEHKVIVHQNRTILFS